MWAFRVDSSSTLGVGHLSRCLTLADALGGPALLLCRDLPGNANHWVHAAGHTLHVLAPTEHADPRLTTEWPEDARACTARLLDAPRPVGLVVDHYGLDARWEAELLRALPQLPLVVIDDLANRPHLADLLIDQTTNQPTERYRPWLESGTPVLQGASFAMLRGDFSDLRAQAQRRRDECYRVERVLVTLGGADEHNVTAAVLDALISLQSPWDFQVDVVLSGRAPHLSAIERRARSTPWLTLHVDTRRMATLMLAADLSIGSAGMSALERCALGLPTLQLVTADNQRANARALCEAGAARPLSEAAQLGHLLPELLADPHLRKRMAAAAMSLCDGRGTARVAERCLALAASRRSRPGSPFTSLDAQISTDSAQPRHPDQLRHGEKGTR